MRIRRIFRVAVALILTAGAASITPCAAGPSFSDLGVSAGGMVPWDSELRRAFGTAKSLHVSYSPRISSRDSRLLLEVGVIESSGNDFRTDPTFERPEASYLLIPLSLGLYANLVSEPERQRVRIHWGLGMQLLHARWRDSNGEEVSEPAVGIFMDLRPGYPLGNGWGIWARGRVCVLSSIRMHHDSWSEVNASGSSLEMGFGRMR